METDDDADLVGGSRRYVVDAADAETRLDRYLAARWDGISRAQIQRIIENGQGTLNGKPTKPSVKLAAGDTIWVESVLETVGCDLKPQKIPLDIRFEDADLLVINKPKGMVVHPAPGTPDGTLVNALLAHCTDLSGVGGVERPGIVHRLDKDTTGLIMVAKNDGAHIALQKQIQARTATRKYVAFIWGSPHFADAVVDAPIARHSVDRKRMAIAEKGVGREAITHVHVDARLGAISRIICSLETGRTHQIRLHCEFAGYPVVGDPVYGGLRRSGIRALDNLVLLLRGQALHAFELGLNHPRTGERLVFTVEPPEEMKELDAVGQKIAENWQN